jgi:hypothetical protein
VLVLVDIFWKVTGAVENFVIKVGSITLNARPKRVFVIMLK